MKSIILPIALLATGFSAYLNTMPAAAADSRNCTKAERLAGNQRLAAIQSNPETQRKLTKRHLPFGAHATLTSPTNEKNLIQGGYIMRHDGDLRTALWTSYELTDHDVNNPGPERVNCFRPDPRLSADHRAELPDYVDKGPNKSILFDRGHMTNDRDLKDNLLEQVNTYVMSNMSPQHCRFNRGIWLSLEGKTRRWAKRYGTIWVTSGAIFDQDNNTRRDKDARATRMVGKGGSTRVAVPSHYYKVVMIETDDGYASIAFLLPHTKKALGTKWIDVLPEIRAAIVPLSKIEQRAGIRLHPELPRDKLQESSDGREWKLQTGGNNLENWC